MKKRKEISLLAQEVSKEENKKIIKGEKDPQKYCEDCEELCGEGSGDKE